jgi:hypothetical protein
MNKRILKIAPGRFKTYDISNSDEEYPNIHSLEFLNQHIFYKFCLTSINNLYVGLINHYGSDIRYVPVIKTPHFVYARYVLKNEPMKILGNYQSYAHYRSIHPQSHSQEGFNSLIKSIQTRGYDWRQNPILVFRHWRRPLPFNRWDVADGFHRLAVLAALGEKSVKVGVLRNKKSLYERFKQRVFKTWK